MLGYPDVTRLIDDMGEELHNILMDKAKGFSEYLGKLNLSWYKLRNVTTDGARNMVGSKTGVVARIKESILKVYAEPLMQFHCIIHQQTLCSKILRFENVMSVAVSCEFHEASLLATSPVPKLLVGNRGRVWGCAVPC